MSRFYYDFHVHSCLSPCADADNTPNNLAGMAAVCGIDIMALTDHNSCKNCPAFFKAAERYGIIPVAGAEITTAEDIHLVALFEELSDALGFDAELQGYRTLFPNRTDIYGEQLITDGEDNVIGTDEYFLPVATSLSLEQAAELAGKYGGVCYPAHIDRQANGIIAVLGGFPEKPEFTAAEFHDFALREEYAEKYGLSEKLLLLSSDAHRLTDIREENGFLELNADRTDRAAVTKELFGRLRGGI